MIAASPPLKRLRGNFPLGAITAVAKKMGLRDVQNLMAGVAGMTMITMTGLARKTEDVSHHQSSVAIILTEIRRSPAGLLFFLCFQLT